MLNVRFKTVLFCSILLGIFLINTQYTDADLFAERNIKNNKFVAITLNFSAKNTVNGGVTSYLFKTLGLAPDGYDLGAVRIKKEGSRGFKYHLKAVKTNGDESFCNALNITVLQRNWSQRYSGSLLDMAINSEINNDSPEDWILFVGLDKNSNQTNKLCEFNLEFRTYKISPDEQAGIYAQRKIANSISSGNW